jgi:hypothetical protein
MPLVNFNGDEKESITITYFVIITLRINDYTKLEAFLFITYLSHYLIILGMP